MSGEQTLYSQGSLKKSGLTQLSNFICWGLGSLCRKHNSTWDNSIGKAVLRIFLGPQQTRQITKSAFQISLRADWQIDNGFFNAAITWHIHLYSGCCLEQGFQRCFADGLNQSLVSPVAQVRSGDGLYMYSQACQ